MRHLLVYISGHGLGHLGQTAPVLTALRRRLPDLHLTVRTPIARYILAARIEGEFNHIRENCDVGYIQHDALAIDHDASREAYRNFHADFPARIAAEAAFLRGLRPSLVLSDVGYLPLAGAAAAGIPALAMSSLNWLDMARHYYGSEAWAQPVIADMVAAYDAVDTFITLTPTMPMTDRPHRTPAGVVARVADASARAEIRQRYGLDDNALLVLLAVGGFHLDVCSAHWPDTLHGRPLHYLTPEAWDGAHARTIPYTLHDDFIALLRAADAVVTKPGYGTFAEAACNGTPVLYLRRQDWPEQESLIPWLEREGRCLEIHREDLEDGYWTEALAELLAQPEKPPVTADGAEQIADFLAERLKAAS